MRWSGRFNGSPRSPPTSNLKRWLCVQPTASPFDQATGGPSQNQTTTLHTTVTRMQGDITHDSDQTRRLVSSGSSHQAHLKKKAHQKARLISCYLFFLCCYTYLTRRLVSSVVMCYFVHIHYLCCFGRTIFLY